MGKAILAHVGSPKSAEDEADKSLQDFMAEGCCSEEGH